MFLHVFHQITQYLPDHDFVAENQRQICWHIDDDVVAGERRSR